MLNLKKNNGNYIRIMNFYFIFNIIFIFSAYLLRDMDIEYSLKTTIERVIFTSSGFFAFLVINFFKNLEKNYR